ncbi:MAG: hypothetical protein ACXWUG_02055 [Polyangiales bacterium]
MQILDFFAKPGSLDIEALAKYLDGLDAARRIEEARALGSKHQPLLWEAAKGHKAITLEDFVPRDMGTMTEVIHHGRNTLPAFKMFQKRFCRPEGNEEHLWGYNEGSTRGIVGPGYFVTHSAGPGEVVIDYTMLPPGKVESWPLILPNSARLGRFVYYGMQDFMRGVSKHVSIGRAQKKGKDMDAWFVLCRD